MDIVLEARRATESSHWERLDETFAANSIDYALNFAQRAVTKLGFDEVAVIVRDGYKTLTVFSRNSDEASRKIFAEAAKYRLNCALYPNDTFNIPV